MPQVGFTMLSRVKVLNEEFAARKRVKGGVRVGEFDERSAHFENFSELMRYRLVLRHNCCASDCFES